MPPISVTGDEFNNSEEVVLRTIADLSPQDGDMLYFSSNAWQRLAKGSDTNILNLGSGVPSWTAQPTRTAYTSYAAGTAYSLTNSASQVAFGTTSPAVTLASAGTYLIFSRVKVDYNAATFAAVRTATIKLRRSNNTAADLTGASYSLKSQIITLLTFTAGHMIIPAVLYTTANTNDIIQIHALVDTVPTAGSLDVSEAEIVALRIY